MNDNITQCRYMLVLADRIFAGLDDSHRALEPQPGTKTAGWIIGHLCVTGDFARKLCGRAPMCPAEWRPPFNPGAEPSHIPGDYPSMAVLCETFRAVYADLIVAAAAADPALLAKPNPVDRARTPFPTCGDFVAYIVSSHLAYHLGQLFSWRAAAGLGRARAPDGAI